MRRAIRAITVCFIVVACTGRAPPNILVVIADDIGFADYGFRTPELRTPTIDALKESGVLLNNYYVQPSCTPTRSALLTGKYPIRNGMQHMILVASENRSMPLQDVTMANVFRDKGYSTHLVGKWHLGFHVWEATPTFRGFDSFYGLYNGIGDYYSHMMGDGYDFHFNTISDKTAYGTYATELFTRRAREIITESKQGESLFLVMAMQSPHTPLQVPAKYRDQYIKELPNDPMRAIYFGMVTNMDESIGEVIEALKDKGIWNNTLVIYTSDNGGPVQDDYFGMYSGANNFPLRGGKFSLAEGGVRGTSIISGPVVPSHLRNTSYEGLFHVVDWLPTLASMSGEGPTDVPENLDGIDLWESIINDSHTRSEVLLNIDDFNLEGAHAAIRVKDWKLFVGPPNLDRWYKPYSDLRTYNYSARICNHCTPYTSHYHRNFLHGRQVQLYNVAIDKEEFYDLAGRKEHSRVLNELYDKLMEYRRVQSDVPNKDMVEDPNGLPSNNGGIYEPWNTASKSAEKVIQRDRILYEQFKSARGTGLRQEEDLPRSGFTHTRSGSPSSSLMHRLLLAWLVLGGVVAGAVWRRWRCR